MVYNTGLALIALWAFLVGMAAGATIKIKTHFFQHRR